MNSFQDGYKAAIRAELNTEAEFSDEAEEAIRKDCADCGFFSRTEEGGRFFWAQRQAGDRHWSTRFPPLTFHIRDDGKIYQREAV